jgi:WD40 repeat protein
VSDADNGEVLFDLEGHTAQVLDIAYSPDGERLVTAGADNTARVWRASSGQSIAVLPHAATVRQAMFTANGRWIVTAASDQVIRVWDAASQTKLAEIDAGPEDLAGFELSPDGHFVITSTEEPSVRVFETGTGSRLFELTGHTGPVFTTRFSPGGNQIVTAGLQLLALARQRVTRPLTEQERAQHLPRGFTEHAPDCR